MENGLYEKLLDSSSKKELEDKNYKQIRNVDNSELSNVLSITYQKMIREILLQKDKSVEKLEFISRLIYIYAATQGPTMGYGSRHNLAKNINSY